MLFRLLKWLTFGWLRGHWQNLNEKRHGRMGWGLFHGRAWMHRRDGGDSVRCEWHWPSNRFALTMTLSPYCCGSGDTVSFALCVPGFSLWFGFEWQWPASSRFWAWLLPGYEERVFGIRIFDWSLWWSFYESDGCWRRSDPWWMQITVSPLELLTGGWSHSKRELWRKDALVPLPEKSYPAIVTCVEREWRLSRLPFRWVVRRRTSMTIEVEGGVPHPGKGTAGYNCGEDALMSVGCEGDRVPEAVGRFVSSVLDYRERYPL